jgi:hypothetical protein
MMHMLVMNLVVSGLLFAMGLLGQQAQGDHEEKVVKSISRQDPGRVATGKAQQAVAQGKGSVPEAKHEQTVSTKATGTDVTYATRAAGIVAKVSEAGTVKQMPKEVPGKEVHGTAQRVLDGKEPALEEGSVPGAKHEQAVSTQVTGTHVVGTRYASSGEEKAPAAKTEQQVAAGKTEQQQDQQKFDEMSSIDTIDLDQPEGNWLQKRIWWERAKDKYKECRDAYEAIFASRMTFFEKKSDIEKTILNPFYREIGLEQAELRDTLNVLVEDVEREREETGFLDEKEREFLDMLYKSKKDLEQLKLDIDTIDDIDLHIDKAVNTLNGKINEAHRFEQSAWQEFEAITRELSDKNAYERYYVIDGLHKNLKELKKYIDSEFSRYFDGLVQAVKDKTERAKKEIQELKDRGINLKEQHSLLVAEEQTDEKEQARIAEQKAAEAAKKAAQTAQGGFFSKILGAVINFFKAIWNALFGWWLYRV